VCVSRSVCVNGPARTSDTLHLVRGTCLCLEKTVCVIGPARTGDTPQLVDSRHSSTCESTSDILYLVRRDSLCRCQKRLSVSLSEETLCVAVRRDSLCRCQKRLSVSLSEETLCVAVRRDCVCRCLPFEPKTLGVKYLAGTSDTPHLLRGHAVCLFARLCAQDSMRVSRVFTL